MIRFILKVGDKWAADLEWGFLKHEPEVDEAPEHDSDLITQTHVAPDEEIEVVASEVPRANKIIGFKANSKKETEDD